MIKRMFKAIICVIAAVCLSFGLLTLLPKVDAAHARTLAPTVTEAPLASWNDSPSKSAILNYLQDITNPANPSFIPPIERIAVFDNDGTLWAEQPMYSEVFFMVDRIRAKSAEHPEWSTTEPFASVLKGELGPVLKDEAQLAKVIAEAEAGMSSAEYDKMVKDWVNSAKRPVGHLGNGRPYSATRYLPMLELINYLKENSFTVYVVTGGGSGFVRAFSEEFYDIPPERVIGSSIKTVWDFTGKEPKIMRTPELVFINDGPEKPLNIDRFIGRRPVFAGGNSDGDREMLEWATTGPRRGFALLVRHTDPEREWAYDRKSPVGTLDKALDEARAKNWTVVDMKKDWQTVFTPAIRP